MEKKIFFLIIGFILALVVSNYVTWSWTDQTSSPGYLWVERVDPSIRSEFTNITENSFDSIGPLRVLLETADSDAYVNSETNKIQNSAEPEIKLIPNTTVKEIQKILHDSGDENLSERPTYYIEYERKYYSLGVDILS